VNDANPGSIPGLVQAHLSSSCGFLCICVLSINGKSCHVVSNHSNHFETHENACILGMRAEQCASTGWCFSASDGPHLSSRSDTIWSADSMTLSLSLFFSLYCILLNPVTFMLDIPRWQQIVTVHRAVFPTLAGSWRKNTPSVGIPRELPELVKPPRPFKSVTGSCHCSCFYESQSACRLYMLVYIYISIYLIL